MSTSETRRGIVVGVDGSAASDAAVDWAAREAAMRNVPLTLVHMFKTFVPTFPQIPMPNGVGIWQEDDGRKVLEQSDKIAQDAVPLPQPAPQSRTAALRDGAHRDHQGLR